MEWSVPLQKLEVAKVQLGNIFTKPTQEKKPVVLLSYVDGQIVMPVFTVLLPHLTIESYNETNGRLELLVDTQWASSKLLTLQKTLLENIYHSQSAWFGSNKYSLDDICRLFQPMIEGNKLHLYCPVATSAIKSEARRSGSTQYERKKPYGTKVWKDNCWFEGIPPGSLLEGTKVRVAIQIQGISLQVGVTENGWTGRSRLQHRILAVLIPNAKKPECLLD